MEAHPFPVFSRTQKEREGFGIVEWSSVRLMGSKLAT